jgi:Lon-like ATP-dependent protease
VEAAIGAGLKTVIVPASNLDDVYLSKDLRKKIRIIPVKTFAQAIKAAMHQSRKRDGIIAQLKRYEKASS